ncbi:ion channel [Pokkaliibacter sp. CJK22405]|uniref:ion channel n=1 Tax=Pokkaliibacter sp. CJK22405 TaxID=3384615 RepID=UPI003984D6C4
MLLVTRLSKRLARHLATLSWQTLLIGFVGYLILSWVGMYLAGEAVATDSLTVFWYWLIVTSSTVGYGDYSASTVLGRWIVSLWVIPFGLAMWGTLIGRIAGAIMLFLQRGIKGLRRVKHHNHTLVIGYNGIRTLQLLRLLINEAGGHADQANLVLCANVAKIEENPMPDEIGFVRVESFNNAIEMERTNISEARSILIDTPLDDVTLTTALFAYQQNPTAHIMAYFDDEQNARLLKAHCPTVECIPSVSVEMLAKAAADPGSSALHHELLNVDQGQTQYSVVVPELSHSLTVGDLFLTFKERHEAILLAVKFRNDDRLTPNPGLSVALNAGDRLYYIADERVTDFRWEKAHV